MDASSRSCEYFRLGLASKPSRKFRGLFHHPSGVRRCTSPQRPDLVSVVSTHACKPSPRFGASPVGPPSHLSELHTVGRPSGLPANGGHGAVFKLKLSTGTSSHPVAKLYKASPTALHIFDQPQSTDTAGEVPLHRWPGGVSRSSESGLFDSSSKQSVGSVTSYRHRR